MSIAIARRASPETLAGQTLQAIKDGLKPEIWKMARMFAPEMELIPVTMQWNIGPQFHNSETYFDGVYFGQFVLNHNSFSIAPSDNDYKRSVAKLWHGDTVKHSTVNGYHGDDILPIESNNNRYEGYATSVSLDKLQNDDGQPHHEVCVSFIGFRLAELPEFVFNFQNDSNGTVRLSVNGAANDILASGGLERNVVLGDTISIYPLEEDTYIIIDGQAYSSVNRYNFNINANKSVTAASPVLNLDNTSPWLAYLQVAIDGGIWEDASDINPYNTIISVRINPEIIGAGVMDADWKLKIGAAEHTSQFSIPIVIDYGSPLFGLSALAVFSEIQVPATVKITSISTPPGVSLPRLLFRTMGSMAAMTQTQSDTGDWVPALPVVSGFGNARLHEGQVILGIEYTGTGKVNGVEYNFPSLSMFDISTAVKVPIALDGIYELTDFAYLLP